MPSFVYLDDEMQTILYIDSIYNRKVITRQGDDRMKQ